MPDADSIKLRVVDRIELVEPSLWDACAGTYNPFVSHSFLNTLEQSGSVNAETAGYHNIYC